VALDAVAVFVNQFNPTTYMTTERLRKIFSGELQSWAEIGGRNTPISLYSRNTDSGTHDFFKEMVLKGRDFSKNIQYVETTDAIRSAVATNPRSIGYGGIGYSVGVHSLKIIAEDSNSAIEPNQLNVVTELYPLSRPLYFYIHPKAMTSTVKAFVKWVLSVDGQRIVTEEQYFPLPKSRRQFDVE
jgi:phosphate transport system substrate-binding protein